MSIMCIQKTFPALQVEQYGEIVWVALHGGGGEQRLSWYTSEWMPVWIHSGSKDTRLAPAYNAFYIFFSNLCPTLFGEICKKQWGLWVWGGIWQKRKATMGRLFQKYPRSVVWWHSLVRTFSIQNVDGNKGHRLSYIKHLPKLIVNPNRDLFHRDPFCTTSNLSSNLHRLVSFSF